MFAPNKSGGILDGECFFPLAQADLCAAGTEGAQKYDCRLVRKAGDLLRLVFVREAHLVDKTGRNDRMLDNLHFIFVNQEVRSVLGKIESADSLIQLRLVFKFIGEGQSVLRRQIKIETSKKAG